MSTDEIKETQEATTETNSPGEVSSKPAPEEEEGLNKLAREYFDMFDTDKSGYVDATEVKNLFRSFNQEGLSSPSFTEEELENLAVEFMKLGDANGDGKVTFDEFYQALLKGETDEV